MIRPVQREQQWTQPTCGALGVGGSAGAVGEGSGTRCRAPPLSQTRLADSSGFSQRGRVYAASISRNSPSLSHTLALQIVTHIKMSKARPNHWCVQTGAKLDVMLLPSRLSLRRFNVASLLVLRRCIPAVQAALAYACMVEAESGDAR